MRSWKDLNGFFRTECLRGCPENKQERTPPCLHAFEIVATSRFCGSSCNTTKESTVNKARILLKLNGWQLASESSCPRAEGRHWVCSTEDCMASRAQHTRALPIDEMPIDRPLNVDLDRPAQVIQAGCKAQKGRSVSVQYRSSTWIPWLQLLSCRS